MRKRDNPIKTIKDKINELLAKAPVEPAVIAVVEELKANLDKEEEI